MDRCRWGQCPRCGKQVQDFGQPLPIGVALAIVELVACDSDEGEWYLDKVQRIEPIPVRGRLGL